MKRIGILTFHRSINYGAFMQAYALSKEIQKRYPYINVEVVDFDYGFKNTRYKESKTNLKATILGYRKQYYAFQKDLKRLNLSPCSFIIDETEVLINYIKSRYDIVIVGSDAVWAFQNKMPLDNPYWLFGERLRDVVKMSYAASAFSVDFEKITKEERSFICSALSSFTYIGVRDNATKTFIDSLNTGIKVNLNHDPTLFLECSKDIQFAESILKKNGVDIDKKLISLMVRNFPFMNDLERILGKKYQMVYFYSYNNVKKDFFKRNRVFVSNITPWEWYNVYNKIDLNITYYFHGALLGIVNNVPTIAIDDFDGKYDSKYKQVMYDLGLSDFLFQNCNLNKNEFLDKIQYMIANSDEIKTLQIQGIETERKKSLSFFSALDELL